MRLTTLGAVATEDGSFRQHQSIVLLAYLAHAGPKDRQHLASIFWPAAKKPLNNLSSALSRIRQYYPNAVVAEDSRVGTTFTTDAMLVLAAAEAGRHDEAIAAYAGRFLDGYRLKSVGIELEEWIFETRESIAGAVSLGAVQASRIAAAAGDVERAADLAETALTISFDGYPLTEHLGYLHGVLAKASRAAAQRVRTEANAMGVELEFEADATVSSELASPAPNSVIGRSDELIELDLLTAKNRLVTVFGFGGIGKTTLVTEFLDRRRQQGGGPAVRVDLGALEDVEQMESLIGSSLGVEAESGSLGEHLNDTVAEPTLLFLDDVSPTAEVCARIEQLIAVVESLSIITTSRPRFPGLESGELRLLGLNTELVDGRSDAARLFAERAVSAQRTGDLTANDWERVEGICQAIGGVPLAIELIAAWLRLVPLDEIVKLVSEGILLDQRLPGATMTLEQVIKQSSALLRPDLRVTLAEISVLQGSFDWLAARSIADVAVSDLAELHDHSMIRLRDQGRMECHPLVAAYASGQLAERPDRQIELRQNHSRYFLRLLSDAMDQMTGPELGSSLNTLAADHDNIEAAWSYAIDEQRWEQLERLIEPIDTYLLRSGQLIAARRLYESARGRLAETEGGWENLRANVANNLAWVHMLQGDSSTATRLCHDTIDQFEDLASATQVALCRTKAALLSNAGQFAEALCEYQMAIELVDENTDGRLWALLREDIGRAHLLLGEVDKARDSFRATLDAAREFKDPHMESRSYLMLGKLEVEREPASALVLFDEGERIAEQHGLLHLRSYFCAEQGRAHLLRSNPQMAEDSFRSGIELAEETGDSSIRAANELGLARTLAATGQQEDARGHFESCLRLALRIGDWTLALGAVVDVGCRFLDEAPSGDPTVALAQELLAFAISHPSTLAHDRQKGIDLLGVDAVELRPAVDLRLDETCERVLQLLRYAVAGSR